MDEFKSRKIKFKAWNTETKLLMRLSTVDCGKGDQIRNHQILLQFTGLIDKEGNEIYEMDVLLIDYDKYLVFWNDEKNGWMYSPLLKRDSQHPFVWPMAQKMKRFCSWFELQETADK
jgi:hypothetical protein